MGWVRAGVHLQGAVGGWRKVSRDSVSRWHSLATPTSSSHAALVTPAGTKLPVCAPRALSHYRYHRCCCSLTLRCPRQDGVRYVVGAPTCPTSMGADASSASTCIQVWPALAVSGLASMGHAVVPQLAHTTYHVHCRPALWPAREPLLSHAPRRGGVPGAATAPYISHSTWPTQRSKIPPATCERTPGPEAATINEPPFSCL